MTPAQLRWRKLATGAVRAVMVELRRLRAANGQTGEMISAVLALREAGKAPLPLAPRPLRTIERDLRKAMQTFRRYADELAAALDADREDLAAEASVTLELAVEQMQGVINQLSEG